MLLSSKRSRRPGCRAGKGTCPVAADISGRPCICLDRCAHMIQCNTVYPCTNGTLRIDHSDDHHTDLQAQIERDRSLVKMHTIDIYDSGSYLSGSRSIGLCKQVYTCKLLHCQPSGTRHRSCKDCESRKDPQLHVKISIHIVTVGTFDAL